MKSNEPAWLIWYEDASSKPEIFAGMGAEEAAKKSFESTKQHWTCRLFKEVIELDESNYPLIVEVTDWNLAPRFYEADLDDLKIMMMLPREHRKERFKEISKPAKVHTDNDADIYLPIYTDDDWEEHERVFWDEFYDD